MNLAIIMEDLSLTSTREEKSTTEKKSTPGKQSPPGKQSKPGKESASGEQPTPEKGKGQSKHLAQIALQRQLGTPMTHVLNYKVSNQPKKSGMGDKIREKLKTGFWNREISKKVTIGGTEVSMSLKWVMPDAGASTAYYYCNSPLYSDEAVQMHTEIVLRSLIDSMLSENGEDYGNGWSIHFLVTRILSTSLIQIGPPEVVENSVDHVDKEEVVGDEDGEV